MAGADWASHLPWVLLGLRAGLKEDSGVSLAELVYSSPLVLPGQPPPAPGSLTISLDQPSLCPYPVPTQPLSYADAACQLPPALLASDFVYVCRGGVAPPLAPAYTGPFAVISQSEKFFTVEMGGSHESISVDP